MSDVGLFPATTAARPGLDGVSFSVVWFKRDLRLHDHAAVVAAAHQGPLPPVDLEAATRVAKARLHLLRQAPEVRAANAAIVDRHASRKAQGTPGRSSRPGRLVYASAMQLSLNLE